MILVIRALTGWVVLLVAAYSLDKTWHPSLHFLAYVGIGLFLWWVPELGKDVLRVEGKLDAMSKN
jgi:hypothetical protein